MTFKLRTGETVSASMLTSVIKSLLTIVEHNDHITLFELTELCKADGYRPSIDSANILKRMSLIDYDGRVDDEVKKVVLASVIYEDGWPPYLVPCVS